MLSRGLVEPEAVRQYFADIEPQLYRYPAIDPESFRRSVRRRVRSAALRIRGSSESAICPPFDANARPRPLRRPAHDADQVNLR